MSTCRRRRVVGIGFLLLLLIVGGLYLVLRPQGNVKTVLIRSKIASTIQTTPTLQALFSENFVDNSQNWDVGNESGYGSTINNSRLTMVEENHKTFREPFPSNTPYSDFMVTATFTLLKGAQSDSVGLYLRATGDMGQGYYIDIYGDDTYDIAKITVDTNQKAHVSSIAEPATTSALHPKGQKNTMTVIMKGPSIVLILNNSVVRSVRDSEFTSGKMSFFVTNGNASSGIVASFDNVAVYTAPERLPGLEYYGK